MWRPGSGTLPALLVREGFVVRRTLALWRLLLRSVSSEPGKILLVVALSGREVKGSCMGTCVPPTFLFKPKHSLLSAEPRSLNPDVSLNFCVHLHCLVTPQTLQTQHALHRLLL